MDSNTICIRISYVVVIVLVGAYTISLYGARALAPIAVCVLPSAVVEGSYTNPIVMRESRMNAPNYQVFHSEISYAGHTATLITSRPLTPSADLAKDAARMRVNLALTQSGLRPIHDEPPPEPTFTVRYVGVLPFFVVPHTPGSSLWSYYGATWTVRECFAFFVPTGIAIVAAYFFRRHLWRSRHRDWR